MKRMNIAKRVLACGLAVAMVVTGGNYSSVNVSAAKKTKKAAKKTKATLSKKKVSMTAGGTVTLKVKKAWISTASRSRCVEPAPTVCSGSRNISIRERCRRSVMSGA